MTLDRKRRVKKRRSRVISFLYGFFFASKGRFFCAPNSYMFLAVFRRKSKAFNLKNGGAVRRVTTRRLLR